jgi:hypothetical protein
MRTTQILSVNKMQSIAGNFINKITIATMLVEPKKNSKAHGRNEYDIWGGQIARYSLQTLYFQCRHIIKYIRSVLLSAL